MIISPYPNRVDTPVIDIGPDTYFEYSGSINISSNKISFPGVPLVRQYSNLIINGITYRIVAQTPTGIIVDRSPGEQRTIVGRIVLGYAVDDGRNPNNWSFDNLTVSRIQVGSVEFKQNFMINNRYTATLLNDVEDSLGGILPAGTSFIWKVTVNYDPTILERHTEEAGLVTLEFSAPIKRECVVDGLLASQARYTDNKILIYTDSYGEVNVMVSGIIDIYGNPVEDVDIELRIPTTSMGFSYNDVDYRVASRNRYDFEDYISVEAHRWLNDKLNND